MGDDAGKEWALSGLAKKKLEERTGYEDIGIIQRPDEYLDLQQMKRTLEDKKSDVESDLKRIDIAVSRAMNKRKELIDSLNQYNRTLTEVNRLDKNFILRDTVMFSKDAISHDISKMGLITGNQEKKTKLLDEVF